MWRRRGQTFQRRGSRAMLRVLAEELAGAVPPRNNGPREPGMVSVREERWDLGERCPSEPGEKAP